MKIVNLNSTVPSNLKDDIGVKALNLTKLSKIEYVDVPNGFVIPISVLRKVGSGELDITDFSNSVLEMCTSYFGRSFSGSIAVRSSSPYEDSEIKSYAGQFLSKLNVSQDSLINDIFEVYRSQQFISGYTSEINSEVAVIIQRMILPDFLNCTPKVR